MVPLDLEYYDDDEDKWCPFKLCMTVIGSIEGTVKITDMSQVPLKPYGRYLYNNDYASNIWFYITTSRDKIRLRSSKNLDTFTKSNLTI